jgi:hypothetical protein
VYSSLLPSSEDFLQVTHTLLLIVAVAVAVAVVGLVMLLRLVCGYLDPAGFAIRSVDEQNCKLSRRPGQI